MIESNKTDWQETLTGEMLLLNLLGRIAYNYPENEEHIWLNSLIAEDIFSDVPFANEKEETKTGLGFFRKWGVTGLTNEAFERLQADYTRLFIGPDKVIAAPWESVYLNEERLTFQEQTLDVRKWFHRFGLEADMIHREPDDHIGLELMFLARLATLGIHALDQQENARFDELLVAQREFLKKHLGAWALTWCGLVKKNARTDFYKGLALLVAGALSELSDMLNIKLEKDAAK